MGEDLVVVDWHRFGDKPRPQPQPEVRVDPLFNGAVREAFLFPQWESGAHFVRKISDADPYAFLEV